MKLAGGKKGEREKGKDKRTSSAASRRANPRTQEERLK